LYSLFHAIGSSWVSPSAGDLLVCKPDYMKLPSIDQAQLVQFVDNLAAVCQSSEPISQALCDVEAGQQVCV
jgi:hypothetical protein